MDNFCDPSGIVVAGSGERVHDWGIHSHPSDYRNRCRTDQDHPGKKTDMIYFLVASLEQEEKMTNF